MISLLGPGVSVCVCVYPRVCACHLNIGQWNHHRMVFQSDNRYWTYDIHASALNQLSYQTELRILNWPVSFEPNVSKWLISLGGHALSNGSYSSNPHDGPSFSSPLWSNMDREETKSFRDKSLSGRIQSDTKFRILGLPEFSKWQQLYSPGPKSDLSRTVHLFVASITRLFNALDKLSVV